MILDIFKQTIIMLKHTLTIFLCLITFHLSAEYFTIIDYKVTIDILKNGELHIEEHIDLNFRAEKRGIIRRIPTHYKLNGDKGKLTIKVKDVSQWNYKEYNKDGYYHIRFGDSDKFISGEQSYVFSYVVQGAILSSEGYQEIYWDIIGTDWDTDILNTSYQINIPSDLDLAYNDYQIFSGKYGERHSKVSMTYESGKLKGQSNTTLSPHEGASIAIKFPNEYFNIETSKLNANKKVNDKTWPAVIVLLISFFSLWFKKGKNTSIDASESDEFFPPDDLSPSQLGYLIDNRSNDEDLLANIPYWANRGLIKVISLNGDNDDGLMLEKLNNINTDAPTYEITLFNGIFKESDYVSLSSLKKKIYKDLHQSKSELSKEMTNSNYFEEQSSSLFKNYKMVLAFITCLVIGILIIAIFKYVFSGIILIAMGIMALVFRLMPSKRSLLGEDIVSRTKSFKDFLANPEHASYRDLINSDSGYLNRMYPYAIAFGVDKTYMKKFEEYSEMGPEWFYIGNNQNSHRGSLTQFQNSFNVESIQSAFKSMPVSSSSSSSGSFSGGGFSGGGTGGGGGSSW
jgi:uncharacterized membrane protein